MDIHFEGLKDVERYIERESEVPFDQKRVQYDQLLRYVRTKKEITPQTHILEVGTGSGWFQIACALDGLKATGIEISPQLVELARREGRKHGVELDIRLGNMEEVDLGNERFDVVIASSVFEHIEKWETALERIYSLMKPGGVLFWESSNKFSFTSGECKDIPLYGWFPDWARYAMRKRLQGEDIMKNGIDFNQFTYPGLRRTFRRVGFREAYDRVQIVSPDWLENGRKKQVLELAKSSSLIRRLLLTFFEVTTFVCVK